MERRQVIQALGASLEQQMLALQEAMLTPAQLFERRLGELAVLEAQTVGAGFEELGQLVPQIQQLVGQIFQLAPQEAVLGQDVPAFEQVQRDMIQILERLDMRLSDIPSFQGLTSPLMFTRPTLAMAHAGETLLPAGRSGDTYNLTVNVPSGSDGTRVGEEIFTTIKQLQQRERFRQTRSI